MLRLGLLSKASRVVHSAATAGEDIDINLWLNTYS